MLDWENIISFDLVQLKADIFGRDTLVWLGALRAKKSSARRPLRETSEKRKKKIGRGKGVMKET